MSQVWSEINKVVNAIIPVADAWDSNPVVTDIVNMENYKKCSFLVVTGASSTTSAVITAFGGVSNSDCDTAIAFKYRTQSLTTNTSSSGDTPSALTDATTTGFAMTVSITGGLYIIEVDASTVAAAGTNFDHCALNIDEDSDNAQTGCVIAVLSEPRYPQAILQTAID